VVLVGLSLYAAASIAITVANTVDSTGGTDLFTYWRINHFTRQGEDPYQAFLQAADIQLPVPYINGDTATTHPIVETDVDQKRPGNSPPILVLLLPLSFLTWGTAKVIWMLLNIALVLATPWLAIRLFASNLSLLFGTMMALVYYGLPGTRASIVTGQTSVITIFLILLTLWLLRNNRKLLGGLALGVSLSKFSVSIPLFLFLIYKRGWRTLAVSLLVQGAAFAGFAILRKGSPFEVLSDFVSIASAYAADPGIHLTGFFEPSTAISILVGIVFCFVVFVPLWFLISRQRAQTSHSELFDYIVFGVLCIWTLLVAYHKAYDIGLVLTVLVVATYALSNPSQWGIGSSQLQWLLTLFIVMILCLSIPVRFIENVLGGWWEPFVTGAVTVDLALLLVASLIILRQIGRIDAINGRATQ
jgi:hypothetical protein